MRAIVHCSTFLVIAHPSSVRCPLNGKPRVRREIRFFTISGRQRVYNAHWIMPNLTTAEGQAWWGPNVMNYEKIVVLHGCTNLDPRCDQGHSGLVFAISQRALVLQFENLFLAIDPKSGPYHTRTLLLKTKVATFEATHAITFSLSLSLLRSAAPPGPSLRC